MLNAEQVISEFKVELENCSDVEKIQDLKVKYLGRKQGILTTALAKLGQMTVEEKRKEGPILNELRSRIADLLSQKQEKLESKTTPIDFSLPEEKIALGSLHPLTLAQNELEDIFTSLGFQVHSGPEVESDWYNFTALNIPEDHPARDTQDTFYIKSHGAEPLVLRTHTSAAQVRFMKQNKPPFSIVIPGRVYRNEATDATHEHTFTQMEGLVVGKNITYANMVWTINHALKEFFGEEVKTKLVPSYFQFVEPGAEMAISSPKFKNGSWVEILGCGMVNQEVFKSAGYKEGEYQGFAFGFGLTRFALMKYGIPDIRMLAENDLRFLKQF